ncbi:GntR family transcriptional regulator [Listeria kieliensis]
MKNSKATEVYYQLLEKIKKGEYSVGQKVTEEELAKDLQVSRSPIRVALTKLEMLNIVECRQYSGARVNLVTLDVEERMNLVLQIEQIFSLYFLQSDQEINRKVKEALKDTLRCLEFAIKKEDLKAWIEREEQFLQLLLKMGGENKIGLHFFKLYYTQLNYLTDYNKKFNKEVLMNRMKQYKKVIDGLSVLEKGTAEDQSGERLMTKMRVKHCLEQPSV